MQVSDYLILSCHFERSEKSLESADSDIPFFVMNSL